jgi:hypothetical protein
MPINSFLYPGPTNSNPYVVENSCRFNDDDTAYMHKTPGGAGNLRTMTFSFWMKRCNFTTDAQRVFSIFNNSGADQFWLRMSDGGNDYLDFFSQTSSSQTLRLTTNARLRDPSAWYHIVVAVDTTQGTDTNRIKIYINGTQQTSFSTTSYPSQNTDLEWNKAIPNIIGAQQSDGTAEFIDMYLAEVCFIDGVQLTPTSFGEFDEDSPTIWKPKNLNNISGTKGTNGFYLDFKDSSNLGNDAWGGTDLTEVNLAAADQATDTPTNNFATLNPLMVQVGTADEPIFGEGNCQISTSTAGSIKFYAPSTIGMTAGKWYAEFDSTTTSNVHGSVGITSDPGALARNNEYIGKYANEYGNYAADGSIYTSHSENSYGNSWTGEIIGVAVDLDNNKLYMSLNGTWQDSGDPTSGATGTGAISITAVGSTVDGAYFFAVSDASPTYTNGFDCNFGGCPAGAISSGNADANGYGNFEYAPPSGYYALCTKNLAEYG